MESAQGLIYRDNTGRVYVPDDNGLKTRILSECHDNSIAGHVGVAKTVSSVTRQFYWPRLHADVHDYVTSCLRCQENKASSRLPAGPLQSLPVPERRWQVVSMDLITQLPRSRSGNDAIVVWVDKLSKMIHCAATVTTIDAPALAQLTFKEVVRHHGLPATIVSDRDPRFTSHFWRCLWAHTGTKLAMSTAYHPQTDGQTERANRTLEDMLRACVSDRQDDWDEHLTAIEIAYNNSEQASTGFTPFYLNSGQHPTFPLSALPLTPFCPGREPDRCLPPHAAAH